MAQPVTAFSPPMLASKLDELSELASRFVNVSDELRMMLHSHLADGESSWKPSNAALSNTTQDRPSLLQPTSQATIPPSSTPLFLQPGAVSSRSPTPVPDFASPLTDLSYPSPPPPSSPATEKWPDQNPNRNRNSPPLEATLESPTYPLLGGRSANEHSPLSRTRKGVAMAGFVHEEDSSPRTRGGTNRPSPPAATHTNASTAHTYPPLSMHIVDVTPHSTMGLDGPEVSRVIAPLPPSPRNPSVSPSNSSYPPTVIVGRISRHSKRKGVSQTTSEATGRRATRSGTKRRATQELETEARPTKRAKSVHPNS